MPPVETGTVEIAAFYKFASIPEPETLAASLRAFCAANEVKGILLVAHEGINGTLAGTPEKLRATLAGIRQHEGFEALDHKTSFSTLQPFLRLKVKVKAEIVTLGEPGVDPASSVGTYVEPEDWNALIADPEVMLVDTRNAFEVRVGTFEGAMDPQTESFGEFPRFVREKLDPARHRKVAMFCTGGIRCEKASSFMLKSGFDEVFHLKGGILKYLERIRPEDSLWQGACFVFDQRVAVGHGLAVEDFTACYGCLMPLGPADRLAPEYEKGVSCPHCAPLLSEQQKASARERHRQVQLAAARGDTHLGPRKVAGP
jgi:UPF0176 protein